MKTITLSPLHDLQIRKPAEWTALVDLTVSWPTDPEDPRFRSRLVRCSAAAIGLVLNDERLPVPAYRTASMDPVAYGVSVLEVLIPQPTGARAPCRVSRRSRRLRILPTAGSRGPDVPPH